MNRTYIDVDAIAEVSRELRHTSKGWCSFGLCHRHDVGSKSLFSVCIHSEDVCKYFPMGADDPALALGSLLHVQGSARLRAWTGEDGSLQTGLDVYPKSISVVREVQ